MDSLLRGDAAAGNRDGATADGAPETGLGSDASRMEAGDIDLRDAASDVAAPDVALGDAPSDLAAPDASLRDAGADVTASDASTGVTLISLTPIKTSVAARVGQSTSLRVSGLYSDMSKQDVTTRVKWTSSDNSVVWPPQSANDLFALLREGEAVLTATLEGVSTTVTFTVSGSGGTLLGVVIEVNNPLMRPGETDQARLSYYYSLGPEFRITNVPWVSSNPAVLSVEGHGYITALSAGTATLSAVIGDKTVASVLITVKDVTLASILIGPSDLTIPLPDPLPITATGVYSDGSKFDLTHKVSWETAPEIAIESSALSAITVKAVSRLGNYPLSASFEGVSASATLIVPFGNPKSIFIDEPPEFPVGVPPYPMMATAMYIKGEVENGLNIADRVTWSIDDPSIASIGADGVVRALKPGTTLIRATYPGFTIAPVTLTVNRAILVSISLGAPTLEVYPEDPQKLAAFGTYDNGQIAELTEVAVWSTGNAQIASVSNVAGNKGAVTGLKVGTTSVRATVGTVSGLIALTVAPHDF